MTDAIQYRTDDMALAAFLMCGGAELAGLEPIERSMFMFRLNLPSALADAPKLFWSGQAQVEPLRFWLFLKRVKGEVIRHAAALRRSDS